MDWRWSILLALILIPSHAAVLLREIILEVQEHFLVVVDINDNILVAENQVCPAGHQASCT